MKMKSVTVSERSQSKGITVLSVKGRIDAIAASELEKKLIEVLSKGKFKLIFDLIGVDYVSSMGWSAFTSQIKTIRGQKGDLVISGMNADVLEAFELLEFNSIFRAFPNVKTAAQFLGHFLSRV